MSQLSPFQQKIIKTVNCIDILNDLKIKY